MKKILTIVFISIILCLVVSSISLEAGVVITETIIKRINPDKIVQVIYLTYNYKDPPELMKELSKCLEKLDVFKVIIIYYGPPTLEPIRAEVWHQKD
jgi:hypothetical protein